MSEMEKKILELVNQKKKGTLTRSEIEKELQLSSSVEKIELDQALDHLEEEYALFRNVDNTYLTAEQNGLVTGVLHVNRKGIGYIDRDDADSVVVYPADQKDALDGDTVQVKTRHIFDSDAMKEVTSGKVQRVIHRGRTFVTGTYESTRWGMTFVPDDEKLLGRHFSIDKKEGFIPVSGLKVVLQIEYYGDPIKASVHKVLGHKDDPGVDILSILMEHDIEPEFPEEVKKQVLSIPQEVSIEETAGRHDLTNVPTVTIDGDDSKDFDDAVAVERTENGWNLKVSIADVTHYVTTGSPLDQEAFKRATSTYAVNSVVPMLPHELSNGICSLNPHVIRLTNTVEMQVTPDGVISSYEVYPSFIRSFERMTYKNVNRILDGEKETMQKYEHLGSLFTDLRDCADAIRARRKKQGAIDFETKESVIVVNEKGFPIDVHPSERGHAERMIEDCMIAANVCVADLMNKHNFPCVYRVHDEPSLKRLKDFSRLSVLLGHPFNTKNGTSPKEVQRYLNDCQGSEEYPVLSDAMLRCMSKAVYDSQCIGHYGLAEKEYLHFTSPIRRYPDLIVHRMLRKYFFEKRTDGMKKDAGMMEEIAEHSSDRERNSDDAEYDAEDMKKAEYMTGKIGMQFTGIISGVQNYGFYVELPDTIEGLVRADSIRDDYYSFDQARNALIGEHHHTVFRVGQSVNVICVAASKEQKRVTFELVRKQDRHSPKRNDQKKRRTRSRSSHHDEEYGRRRKSRKTGRNHNGRYREKGTYKAGR